MEYSNKTIKLLNPILDRLEQNKQTIIILSGIPGSGKSTLAEYLSKINKQTMWLKGDDVWKLVCPSGFNKELTPLGFKVMETIMKGWLAKDMSIIIDTTAVTRYHRSRFINLTRRNQYVCSIALKPNLELSCERRNGTIPSYSIDSLHAKWEEPHIEEGFDDVMLIPTPS